MFWRFLESFKTLTGNLCLSRNVCCGGETHKQAKFETFVKECLYTWLGLCFKQFLMTINRNLFQLNLLNLPYRSVPYRNSQFYSSLRILFIFFLGGGGEGGIYFIENILKNSEIQTFGFKLQ